MKIKKDDQIIVTIGKDKGKKAKVEHVFRDGSILVPGLNIYKKHTKARGEKQPGGVIEVSRSFVPGKVALICPKCNKPTRVGFEITGKEKQRICRKCGEII